MPLCYGLCHLSGHKVEQCSGLSTPRYCSLCPGHNGASADGDSVLDCQGGHLLTIGAQTAVLHMDSCLVVPIRAHLCSLLTSNAWIRNHPVESQNRLAKHGKKHAGTTMMIACVGFASALL